MKVTVLNYLYIYKDKYEYLLIIITLSFCKYG